MNKFRYVFVLGIVLVVPSFVFAAENQMFNQMQLAMNNLGMVTANADQGIYQNSFSLFTQSNNNNNEGQVLGASTTLTPVVCPSPTLVSDLKSGKRDAFATTTSARNDRIRGEVTALQEFLWQYHGLYGWRFDTLDDKSDFVTGVYGGRTANTVKDFQDWFHVDVKGTTEYGKVLQKTRTAIQAQCAPIIPPPPPSALPRTPNNFKVTGVVSTTSPYAVHLNWADPANNETGFTLERATGSSTVFTTISNTISPCVYSWCGTGRYVAYTDSTVALGNIYAYRVSAQNIYGSSTTTPVVYAKIGTITPPPPPPVLPRTPNNFRITKIITATATSGPSVVTAWNDASNNETNFVLERVTGSSTVFSIVSDMIPACSTCQNYPTYSLYYTDPTVATGNIYGYRLSAKNSFGSSTTTPVVYAKIGAVSSPPPLLNTNTITKVSSSIDVVAPVVSIVIPVKNGQATTTSKSTVLIAAAITDATDAMNTLTATWQNAANGTSGVVTPTAYGWLSGQITLVPGTANAITITAKDRAGNKGTATVYVTRTPVATASRGRTQNTATAIRGYKDVEVARSGPVEDAAKLLSNAVGGIQFILENLQ